MASPQLKFAFQLRLTQQQHATQLVNRDAAEEQPDQPEGQAQVLKRDDPVEVP